MGSTEPPSSCGHDRSRCLGTGNGESQIELRNGGLHRLTNRGQKHGHLREAGAEAGPEAPAEQPPAVAADDLLYGPGCSSAKRSPRAPGAGSGALLAFPVGAPAFRPRRRALRRRGGSGLVRRFLGRELSGSSRGLAHATAAVPLNLLVLAVTVYGWSRRRR